MSNEEKKIALIKKIHELAQICSINGAVGEDAQSLFIGEAIKVILVAASEQNHAILLNNHIVQFLEEVRVMEGDKEVNEFLCFDLPSCPN